MTRFGVAVVVLLMGCSDWLHLSRNVGQECVVVCGPGGTCPAQSGLMCGPDGYCHADANLNHCPAGGDGGAPVCDDCTVAGPYNYVFVTSSTHLPGDLGGPAGADRACQQAAQAGPAPAGSYKAWLSTPTAPASTRMRTTNGQDARGWIRVDGRPFADALASLVSGRIYYPARLDESGHDWVDARETGSAAVVVMTSLLADGTYVAGDAVAASSFGFDIASRPMPATQAAHLYCFGVDYVTTLTIVAKPGPRAFLSSQAYPPGGDYDGLCQGEAAAAGLQGTVLALLSTTSFAAASRVGGGPWIRADGIPWVASGADLSAGRFATALNVDLNGGWQNYVNVWTGSASPASSSLGSGQSCSDWRGTSGTGWIGVGSYSNGALFSVGQDGQYPCTQPNVRLYCLQQTP
jgi:hypothetical protein